MYKYLTPILLFLLCNFVFGQGKTLPKEIKQEEVQVINPNTLPDSIQRLLDKKNVTQEERVDALCKAMDYYTLIQEFHKIEPYIIELESITKKSNNIYYEALFYHFKGIFNNNDISVIDNYLESIRLINLLPKNIQNQTLEIKNYLSISRYYFNYDMLLPCYNVIKKGLKLNNEINNEELNFKLNVNLANLFYKIGLKNECFDIYNNCNQLINKLSNISNEKKISKSMLLNNMGLCYFNESKYDFAITYFDSALCYAITPFLNSILLNNIGIAYAEKQNIKKAEYYFNKSLNMSSNNNDLRHNYCLTLYNVAYLKMVKQEFDSALIYANKVIDIAKKYNFLIYVKDALSIKKTIFGELNNYKKFTEISKEFDLISDSINNIQNVEGVKKAVLQEQALEKEKEFNDEIKRQNYQNKKDKISLIIIILMLLIIVVILIYIYKLSIDKKRIILNNKKIKEEALSKELEFNKKELDLRNRELDLRNRELDLRNRELTSNMLLQTKNDELLNNTIRDLNKLSDEGKIKYEEIQPLISNLKQSLSSISYDNFKLYFVKVHPNFFNNLLQDYPDLTQNELRILAYYKINLSNSEIASILNLTSEGVRSAKFRIKKKLNVSESDESLIHILSKY